MLDEKTCRSDLRKLIDNIVKSKHLGWNAVINKAYSLAIYFDMKKISLSETDILAGSLQKHTLPDMYPRSLKYETECIEKDGISNCYCERMVEAEEIGLFTRAPGAHVVPEYNVILNEGISARIDRIQKLYKQKKDDEDKKEFYRAEYIVLNSMKREILRYADCAETIYNVNKTPNIKRIMHSCRRIADFKPSTFFDAVQLLILLHAGILDEAGSGSISFGRLDQYLYPFYKRDIDSNIMNEKEAYEIIKSLWTKLAEYTMSWQNVTLGGNDINGKNECNELTAMFLRASLDTHADQPQISLRIGKNMPDEMWNNAFDLVKTGMGFPEFYNDDIAVKAKMNAGISKEDAWNYSIVGCVEITAGGKEYSHTEGARINWAKLLELMLNENEKYRDKLLEEPHSLDDFHSFMSFYEWYKGELDALTRKTGAFIDTASDYYHRRWSVPLTSSMMNGCIERGHDVTDYGTEYNNLTIDCVGIASVANSLEAIEQIVFNEKILTLKEFAQVLSDNYAGQEKLRLKLSSCAKYGNDIDLVDSVMSDIIKSFTDTIQKMKRKHGVGKFQTGFYTSYFHSSMGKMTGATPDGRFANTALSSSLSPMAGTDTKGPTALINSANKIDMSHFGNGSVLDLKFVPTFFENKKHVFALKYLIEQYFNKGGMEIQFNVVDRDTLIDARKHPENHRDLIVRVSGFSAYFIVLDKALQDEIINRTAQCL